MMHQILESLKSLETGTKSLQFVTSFHVALGEIKVVNEKIQSVLLWALRFEDEPGVRMEACVALRKLKCNASEVILVLQDRVLVEPDQGVKK